MAVNVNGGALEFNAVINAAQFNAAISQIEKQLAGLTTTAEKEANAIDNLIKKTTTAIASYAAFAGGSNFVGDIVRVRGEFQQLEIAFRTMLGSKEKADKLMMELTQFAATTPFELKDVAGAAKQLLAFGIGAENMKDTLRQLGDVSAGIGQPLGEIAYLFGTIKTQGVALTQDVRQFAQRGIPVYEELAKVLNVSTEQVGDFISAGKVGFPQIEQVFKNLTAEGSKFGGLMEAQSKSLTGQISNLRDAWDEMLNTIGKGQEGLFSDIIQGAIAAVKNFDTIIDILKVLVITYGSYKAAIIATTAVQSLATAATKGYTVAETLRYRAMLLSERAMKFLNKAMLTNPFVAVTTAVVALVAALAIFNRRASEAKSKAALLAEAQKGVGDRLAETQAKILPYLDALKGANISEQQRVDIYNKLAAIDPKIVEGLNAKTLKYEDLKKNVDLYVEALRKQYLIEANKEALQESIKQEQVLSKKLEETKKKRDELLKNRSGVKDFAESFLPGGRTTTTRIADLSESITNLTKDLQEQQQATKELGATQISAEAVTQAQKERTLKVIEEEIKALKDQQTTVSSSAKQYQDYQNKINALEEEKKRITGASKSEIKAVQAEENKALSLLEKRKDLLEQIEEMQRNADQSGMIKQQSELDKINERYDAVIDNITKYNAKVDEFNKKNPKNQVQKVGQADIVNLNNARAQELDNSRLKEQADQYKKYLEDQKRLFEQYEAAKNEVGITKANELFGEQTKGYSDFLQLLQTEAARLLPKIQLGIANVGEVEKFKALIDNINDYTKESNARQIEDEKRKFAELLQASATYAQQRATINQKYDELEATLRKNYTGQEFEERNKLLQEARNQELNNLKDEVAMKLPEFKRLFEGIENFSDSAAKKIIADAKAMLDKLLAEGKISQELAREITLALSNAGRSLDERLPARLGELSRQFSNLSSAVEQFDSRLADVLSTLNAIIAGVADVKTGISDFKNAKDNGDVLGQVAAGLGIVGTVVGVVGGVLNIFKKQREARRREQAEIQEFLNNQIIGEQEIKRIYRQRTLEQIKLNKLRLEGLNQELDLLKQQKAQVQDNYASVFAELQKQTFKSLETFNVGSFTYTKLIEQSLGGKSFQQIEELFLKGQLEGKAKDLFELLQRLKQEGADIDALLLENQRQAAELFTGTTTDSIVDAIADGFANGKRSMSDFAGTFEDLMRQAMINSLKYQYLEAPLKEFYEEFAAASQTDGQLTAGEIEQLQNLYNSIITNAQAQFDQLQQISGLNISQNGASSNSLTGAIKGITEQQAELLAGQFGGLRITALEQLSVARRQLDIQNQIQVNTGIQIARMTALLAKFDAYETGSRKLYVQI